MLAKRDASLLSSRQNQPGSLINGRVVLHAKLYLLLLLDGIVPAKLVYLRGTELACRHLGCDW